ncbi:MAG: hypothetical protein M3Y87_18210 [Myxococcota bacterium]|nr:hypothetical protein [Myxococcota bacterium]
MSDISFSQYGGPPKVAAHYAKPLIRLMRNQAPDDLARYEQAHLETAEQLAESLEIVLKQRDAVGGVRNAFLDFVNAWAATHGGIEAVSRIPASASNKGARAAKLLAITFPDGLSFTRLPAAQAWAFGDRLVSRIVESGAKQQIDELVGTDHLQAAKKATVALGEIIGVGKTVIDIPDPTAVQHLLAKFQRAVGRYSRVMLAKVDDEDQTSIERFRKAVAIPIDRYRSTRTARDGEPTDPSEPIDPTEDPIDVTDPTEPEAPFAGPGTPALDPSAPFAPEA